MPFDTLKPKAVVMEWVKIILTLFSLIAGGTLAYADLKSDTQLLRSHTEGKIELLQQRDQHIEESLKRIEQLLRDEFDRHHR